MRRFPWIVAALFVGVWRAPASAQTLSDDSITARGEPDCTGGNSPDPTVGGCTDGSFGTAWSAALSYSGGPFYATGAYEYHAKVDRSGDDASNGGRLQPVRSGSTPSTP